MSTPAGMTFVWGKDRDTARALLDAARNLELDPSLVVKSVDNGFRVPDAVADLAADMLNADRLPDDPAHQF